MIDRQQLLKELQGLLPKIEQDIQAYTDSKPALDTHLKDEYTKAKEANRTAEHFIAWREVQITQAAVAWILTCVFIRFLEDNELLDEPLIAGPAGSRLQHAKDRLTVYFSDNPTHAEREYLLNMFTALEQLPVMAELLDHRHNPLWQLPVSADGAKQLIDFFQKLDAETGDIIHDFTDKVWDTRFLGDLYQDLSESVRKRYALCAVADPGIRRALYPRLHIGEGQRDLRPAGSTVDRSHLWVGTLSADQFRVPV